MSHIVVDTIIASRGHFEVSLESNKFELVIPSARFHTA